MQEGFSLQALDEAIRKQLREAQQLMHTTCFRLPTRENTTVTQLNTMTHQCVRPSDRTVVDFLKAKLGAKEGSSCRQNKEHMINNGTREVVFMPVQFGL